MPQSKDKYKLITGRESDSFSVRVTEKLQQGYELYGSPALSFDGEEIVFAQALIRPTKQLV